MTVLHRHWLLPVSDANGRHELQVTLHWDATVPLEILMFLKDRDGVPLPGVNGEPFSWALGRDLIAAALRAGYRGEGVGDVRVRCRGLYPGTVEVELRVDGHRARFDFPRAELAGFVNRTRGVVDLGEPLPHQCEHCSLNAPEVGPAVVLGADDGGTPVWLARALCPDCLEAATLKEAP